MTSMKSEGNTLLARLFEEKSRAIVVTPASASGSVKF